MTFRISGLDPAPFAAFATMSDDDLARNRARRHIATEYPGFPCRVTLDDAQLGTSGSYFVWAQFVPWHNPVYLDGNGQDMAQTGAIRITTSD